MSGDFLQKLYWVIGLFVALTAVMWLFNAALRRDIRRLADDVSDLREAVSYFRRSIRREFKGLSKSVRRMGKGIRREIRWMDGDLSGGFKDMSREVRELGKGVRGLEKDMQEVKDLLGIETDFPPQRSRSSTDDGGRDR